MKTNKAIIIVIFVFISVTIYKLFPNIIHNYYAGVLAYLLAENFTKED